MTSGSLQQPGRRRCVVRDDTGPALGAFQPPSRTPADQLTDPEQQQSDRDLILVDLDAATVDALRFKNPSPVGEEP